MKAIVSTTYDNQYLFFLPIIVFTWNKLGVDVICFAPNGEFNKKQGLVFGTVANHGLSKKNQMVYFDAPKHKQATYAQVSRLYAACLEDLQEDEILVTGDIDMAVFKVPPFEQNGFTVWGIDLVPQKQYPMCYLSATVKDWRNAFDLNKVTCQQALDRLLGEDECQDYRACRWAVDQEQAYNKISLNSAINYIERARPGTQFADNRVDRDDINWRRYVNSSLVDAHLWRPGYTDENFANIMELLTTMYPNDDFSWLVQYRNEYIKLI